MTAVIQVKRGTAAAWTSANTVLAAGEVGFETDTKKMKVGDGSTAWTSLGYMATDGDISSVVAGTGLSGGGTSGAVTVSLDTTSTYVVPSQTGHNGKYLTTNGTATSWSNVDLSGKTDKNTLTTTGDIYYASSANTPARLGIGSTGQILTVSGGVPAWNNASTTFRGVQLKCVTQQVASASTLTLAWTQEDFDTDNFHDNVTNNSRITIPAGMGGKYFFYSYIHWQDGQTNTRHLNISVNGSTVIGAVWSGNNGHTYYMTQGYSGVTSLNAGDYLTVSAQNNDSSAKYVYAESGAGNLPGTRFGVVYLGA